MRCALSAAARRVPAADKRLREKVPLPCGMPAVDVYKRQVKERVVFGTEIIAATIHRGEDGGLYATYAIDDGVRLFLHQPCRDMVDALCR